ncbi:DoxX family protein [Flavihumibacter fluvii]|uniref:DoxX family protein n=1 Tax=Flavihumibacter fluvii TaxID=2838157 RepID=UPI001BDE96BA|nr:DoxX family protein [Flavihumibacter fluvii]ULQ51335.1 DoxX family protein [Flavihumibacter fluvii]
MKQMFFSTGNHWTGFLSRMALGLILLPHGLQKSFGWLGGYGFSGTMGYFTEVMRFPWLLSLLIILTEFVGALCLLAGFATRFWTIAVIFLMLGSIVTVHWQNGFFMNWNGTAKGEGFEYHLAIITLSLITLLKGAGKYSADKKIAIA